jgi:hypothetical protein
MYAKGYLIRSILKIRSDYPSAGNSTIFCYWQCSPLKKDSRSMRERRHPGSYQQHRHSEKKPEAALSGS